MAKKNDAEKAKDDSSEKQAESKEKSEAITPDLANLPKEAQEKLAELKEKLDKFQKKVLEKFKDYVIGISLLPPEKQPEGAEKKEEDKKGAINVLVLVDDSDSTKMSKDELSTKLSTVIESMAKEIDDKLLPKVLILSELWQSCYDAKYELLQMIAMSAPIYDTGMLSAIKIGEIHKSMVIKKFEKYIVSYVLAGSLVKGKATKTSDIDVWIVIDDTDVKRMTRAELKDKLRAIIITMGIEAGEITGIKNKLNIQVYILTDFWESLKEANPIIFTLLRDGVPLYDKGIFMPWKQLLQMGRIKPSQEAIDMFMNTGEQMLKRVEFKLKDIGMEDIYYAILTPSQAALMLYGVAPPDPKETVEMMREIFVKKQKLLEDKYVDILERNVKLRKDVEHGEKKEISGKDIDNLLKDADSYLKRIQRLFTQIQKIKEEEGILHLYESSITAVRDILKGEGLSEVSDSDIYDAFNKKLICSGKIPAKFLRSLKEIIKAKQGYDEKTLSKSDITKTKAEFSEFIKYMIEYMQREHAREMERAKIKVKYSGDKYGEVIVSDKSVFIIKSSEEGKKFSKAKLLPDGSFGEVSDSTIEEMDSEIASLKSIPKIFLKEKTFEEIKKIFGKDVEILMNI
ncbi:MAG: nucleotidyltransferase domain-containing protein [Candidatus Woesearchaeota archaeon]|nr:nucleotidyltransferase domain-containing protein [Candidatus Woesearchaeota archaeon]